MSTAITGQPAANSLNVAYRPIIISVSIIPAGPVMYCDVYFNNVYYETLSKTQGFDFDIQSKAKEYLKTFLPTNGGTGIQLATPLIATAFVKIRNSTINVNGFLQQELPAPVQGTGLQAPIAGGGVKSNTFYIVNATLQQEDNQNFTAHLDEYKQGTWSGTTHPLTQRPGGYVVTKDTSDHFPIITDSVPDCVKINYRLKSDTAFGSASSCGGSDPPPTNDCIPINHGSVSLPEAHVNTPYNFVIPLTGDLPHYIQSSTKPTGMNVTINSAGNIVVSGTPIAAGSALVIIVNAYNDCGTTEISTTVDVLPNTPSIEQVSNIISEPTRTQTFTVHDVAPGNKFYVEVYSHHVEIIAVEGDTPATIAQKLANAVNATTEVQWDDAGSAPASGTPGFPPFAQYPGSGATFAIMLNSTNQFAAGATVN